MYSNIIRSIALVMIVLVLSCDEYFLPEEIEGCTTESTCNYNAEATVDDGSCVAPQGCKQWCEGDATTIAAFDCAGVCGGGATIDACNNCGGDCVADENEFFSCSAGNVNNLITADVCGVCGGSGFSPGKCDCDGNVLGCDGVCGSGLVYDNCEICDGDITDVAQCGADCNATGEHLNQYGLDCAGDCEGNAVEDECGVCGGENSTCDLGVTTALVPVEYDLLHNYPNPFNPATTISFSLPQFGTVSIIIYDLTGREVITLIEKSMDTGVYSLNWDASASPSGLYLIQLIAEDYIETRKLMLLK